MSQHEIELTVTTKERRKMLVEFPIYRRHDFDSDYRESTCYTRIEDGGKRAVSVTVSKEYGTGDVEFELEINTPCRFDGSDADYHLGRGQYASSREEFDAAIAKLRAALDSL